MQLKVLYFILCLHRNSTEYIGHSGFSEEQSGDEHKEINPTWKGRIRKLDQVYSIFFCLPTPEV